MINFMDGIQTGTREEFMDSITETCEKFGFIHGDESWAGDTIYVKIKAGRVGFDIIAKYDEDEDIFCNIGYHFDSNITAYYIDSVMSFNENDEYIFTFDDYKTKDKQDALNYIGQWFNAVIAYDEGSFIMYDDKTELADEDSTFTDMEWFCIAYEYGGL